MFDVYLLIDGKWELQNRPVNGPRKHAMANVRSWFSDSVKQQIKLRRAK